MRAKTRDGVFAASVSLLCLTPVGAQDRPQDDFLRRQRFYVVMWMDYHPAKERGAGPQALDRFISGLTIPIR